MALEYNEKSVFKQKQMCLLYCVMVIKKKCLFILSNYDKHLYLFSLITLCQQTTKFFVSVV